MSVSIKDVAAKAGVSTATVSKILNGYSSISEETTQRVKDVMKELDYHPNRRARNFAKQSTRTIMFVTSMKKKEAFENPHMFEIMSGLLHTLSEKNYALILISVEDKNYLDLVKQIIREKAVDGMVFHVSVVTKELEKLIKTQEIPHMVIGCPDFATQLCWIDNNNIQAGEMAAKYLLDMGYQKISFIGGVQEDNISENRLQGLINHLNMFDKKIGAEYIFRGDSTIESGYNMMKQLLQVKARPEVVLCANNYLAYGAVKAIQSEGIIIPDELGVMTFDDYPFSKITEPSLTVVDIDVYDLGRQAAKHIIKKIKQPNLQIQSYITLTGLTIRNSTHKK